MRITVADARTLAAALTAGADEAEQAGQSDFEAINALQALDDQARAQLQAAIDAAKTS
jgi:hypothetical protein